MVALDLYFHHLTSQTGAQEFVIVRDDATMRKSTCCPGLHSSDPPLSSTPSPQHKVNKSRPQFQRAEKDERPPSQPQRVESQDDLYTVTFKKSYNRHANAVGVKHLNHRLTAMFGQGIAESITSKDSSGSDLLSALGAPKFPIRKGSHDDLSTLETNRRRLAKGLRKNGSSKKLDLINILDEATGVLSRLSKSHHKLKRGSSDEADELSSQGSGEMTSRNHERWIARPSLQSLSAEATKK